MNPHYNSYMSGIHTPAKIAEAGDVAILFPGELSLLKVQSCLAGCWNKQFDCCTAHLFVGDSVACNERQLLSIEPTLKIKAETDWNAVAEDPDVIKHVRNKFKNM